MAEDFFHTLGKKGAILIIRTLMKKGKMNYSEIELLLGRNPKITSTRLEELIRSGLLIREVMSDKYRTVEYSLTEKGREITNLIEQITVILSE